VSNRAGLEPALNRVESELGGIGILVNNAGNVSLSGGVLQEKPEDWDNVIETQLNAVFLLSKLAARSMVSRKGGKIINIGSMYSFFGSGLVPSYRSSERGDSSN
jgi:2-deoxy-D-gluconate 3-dehydrogenase